MQEFKAKFDKGQEIDGKTLVTEDLLKELEVDPDAAEGVFLKLKGHRIGTWRNLMDVQSKEKLIEYAGGDEASGTTIWNKLEEYRNIRPLTLRLLGLGDSPSSATVLAALIHNGVDTWGKLLAVESKEKLREYVGGDEASGERIWVAIQKFKPHLLTTSREPVPHDLLDYFPDEAQQKRWQTLAKSPNFALNQELTEFVRAIKSAPLLQVSPDQKHPAGHVTWKIINIDDNLDGDNDEGTPPTRIVAVTLPTQIPELKPHEMSDTLFFLQSDLQVLQLASQSRITVCTGNPGVAKSVLQWKLLVLYLQPSLWGVLKGQLCNDALVKRFQIMDDLPFKEFDPFLRVVSSETLQCYFVKARDGPVVYSADVSNELLRKFNSKNVLVMWEPGSSREPVPYLGLNQLSLFVTVSPDTVRYKELMKQMHWKPLQIYVPCPTVGELLAMARFCHDRSEDDFFSPTNVKERIGMFGPFTRYVIFSDPASLSTLKAKRANALSKLDPVELLKTATIETAKANADTSHFLLRTVVNRDNPDSFISPVFKPSSGDLKYELAIRGSLASIAALDEILLRRDDYDASQKGSALQALVGEQLHNLEVTRFVRYPVVWKTEENRAARIQGSEFTLKKMKLVKHFVPPPFAAMKPRVLYYPSDPQLPAIDIYWKETTQSALNAGQISAGATHAKSLETYWKLFTQVGVARIKAESDLAGAADLAATNRSLQFDFDPNVKINFYYITWQRNEDAFRVPIVLSTFFKEIKGNEAAIEKFLKHVTFHVLIVQHGQPARGLVQETLDNSKQPGANVAVKKEAVDQHHLQGYLPKIDAVGRKVRKPKLDSSGAGQRRPLWTSTWRGLCSFGGQVEPSVTTFRPTFVAARQGIDRLEGETVVSSWPLTARRIQRHSALQFSGLVRSMYIKLRLVLL